MKLKILIFAFCVALPLAALTSCTSKNGHEGHTMPEKQKKQMYHCPMHPTYTADKPGDCPICGMRLVPIAEEQKESAVDDKNASGVSSGHAPVSLSQERRQLIGVRTAPVELRSLKVLIRASGRVAYDPDLYNAMVEHVEALKAREKVKESPLPEVHERAQSLIRSSGLRLRQMGLSQEQIEKMNRNSIPPENLLLGENGGSVWVYAQIYEYEAGLVEPGQIMEVESAAAPGQPLKGRVIAVDPILNPETRTLRVRGEVSNLEGLLKPEMYVDATIHINLGRRLAAPKEAVLDSGSRKILFVEESPGRYSPREIRVGKEAENHYEILSGVKEGEKIVVSANFLIDSESRLKSAISSGGHQH